MLLTAHVGAAVRSGRDLNHPAQLTGPPLGIDASLPAWEE